MRTLKKFNLSELERELDVVLEQEQRETMGGAQDWNVNIPGFSDFEDTLANHYLNGTGSDYDITNMFGSIVEAAASCSYTSRWETINGVAYEVRDVDFYGTESYGCAFGTASLYYDQAGTCVGFADTYDFDSHDDGRDWKAKLATAVGSTFGCIGAKSFKIEYGIHE